MVEAPGQNFYNNTTQSNFSGLNAYRGIRETHEENECFNEVFFVINWIVFMKRVKQESFEELSREFLSIC